MVDVLKVDVLDAYFPDILSYGKCRNIKSPERLELRDLDTHGIENVRRRFQYKKLSLAAVPTKAAFLSFLVRTLDLSEREFYIVYELELRLHKFAKKHEQLYNRKNILKKFLYRLAKHLKNQFREVIPSNLVTRWIYWNKCRSITQLLNSVIIMGFDAFIILKDLITSRRYIYRTTVNNGAGPTLLTGSTMYPVFAYAENTIYFPSIFVVGYPQLRTISKLSLQIKGRYIGIKFTLRTLILTLKQVYPTANRYSLIIWNWSNGEKIFVYEQEPFKDIHTESIQFSWNETIGLGLFMQRNTTFNEQSQLISVIHVTLFRQRLHEKFSVFYKTQDKFYRSFVPGDICVTPKSKIFVLCTKGHLYEIEGFVLISLFIRKRYALKPKRPQHPVRLLYYRQSLLISGPDGVLKMYSLDSDEQWHCQWWMDIADTLIYSLTVFGRTENLYCFYPNRGVLMLNDGNFELIYKYEELQVQDIILVQPACEYVLAVCDRRNVLVLRFDNGEQVTTISLPQRFDKFPYLSNPGFPYIIFISDRVGMFHIYDIEDVCNPFVAVNMKVAPNRILKANFSNAGMLLNVWVGSLGRNFLYWAARKDKFYKSFKIILRYSSLDDTPCVCPYISPDEEPYILVMERTRANISGNQVFIYKFPERQLSVFRLDAKYRRLHYSMHSVTYFYGQLVSNQNKFVRFTLDIKHTEDGMIIQQTENNKAFTVPHDGEFELVIGHRHIFSYGIEDGLIVVMDLQSFRRLYSGYFHRGFLVNFESNRFGGGGIRKCLITPDGMCMIVMAESGMVTSHRFRSMDKYMGPALPEVDHKDLFRCIELYASDSCTSIDLAIKDTVIRQHIIDKIINSPKFANLRFREQELIGSKWAHSYATHFSLNMIPEILSVSSSDTTTIDVELEQLVKKNRVESEKRRNNTVRKSVLKGYWEVQGKLFYLLRTYYHNGRMLLPFTLFILDRQVLRWFFLRLHNIEHYTDTDIRRRMTAIMNKIISLVKVFREPFINAELIRGFLNPDIKVWSIGLRMSSVTINWKRICEMQWFEKTVMNCAYSPTTVFPVNTKFQKAFIVNRVNLPDISYLFEPEVLHITRRKLPAFKIADLKTIDEMFKNIPFEKTLQCALEFFEPVMTEDVQYRLCTQPVDHEGLWNKLCTLNTSKLSKHLDKEIDEAVFKDEERRRLGKSSRDYMKQLLESSPADYFEFKDKYICRECRTIPLYNNCLHKPSCKSCFHLLRCTLGKNVFPQTTAVVIESDIPPRLFCKPMRHLNSYRYTLHPHMKICSLNPDNTCELPYTQFQAPLLQKDDKHLCDHAEQSKKERATSKGSKKQADPITECLEKKKELYENAIWDETLDELLTVFDKTNDIETLLRELFFKCSRRTFCLDAHQYTLLKSLKHFMHNITFFPSHTYLVLPWLREIVDEVGNLSNVQGQDYEALLAKYPQILSYKKEEYFDVFMIPNWSDKFMKMIVEVRKSLNLKLAKIYVMYSYDQLIRKEDDFEQRSDSSYDSDEVKSPADVICGYEKVPCRRIIDASENMETYRFPDRTVHKVYPTNEKLITKIYSDNLRKLAAQPLRNNMVLDWLKMQRLSKLNALLLFIGRDVNNKYLSELFKEHDESTFCPAWFTHFKINPLLNKHRVAPYGTTPFKCFYEWDMGSRHFDLEKRYILKSNLILAPNAVYQLEQNPAKTTKVMKRTNLHYKALLVNNALNPFLPIRSHNPKAKAWRPLTLKLLLNAKKPLSRRLTTAVERLSSPENPSETYEWLKCLLELLSEIRCVMEKKFFNNNFAEINKQQYKDFRRQQELYYPISAEETARWIALIIHKLTIINQDVIENVEKIFSYYCDVDLYRKNPLIFPQNIIASKPFDPRNAFKTLYSARHTASENQTLVDELKRTDLLCYDHKMFEPQGTERALMYNHTRNREYLLKILINRKFIEKCAKKSKLKDAPNEWFSWKPMQAGTPNWTMMLTVAVASQIFCHTLSSIIKALYNILNEAQSHIMAEKQFIKKRVQLPREQEKDFDIFDESFVSDLYLAGMPLEEIRFVTNVVKVRDTEMNLYTKIDVPVRLSSKMHRRRPRKAMLKSKFNLKKGPEKLRMEREVELMLKDDKQGIEMYLEEKRGWHQRFSSQPLKAGFPPVFDQKTHIIVNLGIDTFDTVWSQVEKPLMQFSQFMKENDEESLREKYSNKCQEDLSRESDGETSVREEVTELEKRSYRVTDKRRPSDFSEEKNTKRHFLKMLILDGPVARYTSAHTYYSHRFENLILLKSKDVSNNIQFTIHKLFEERQKLMFNLRSTKHHIVNLMLVIHIREEQIKKQLAYFCENYDYLPTYYWRELKLKPDEKLNHLYQVDDEDNKYLMSGELKKRRSELCVPILEEKNEVHQTYEEKALNQMIGGTMKRNFLSTLKRFWKPSCLFLDFIDNIDDRQRRVLERYFKRAALLEKERDLLVMDYKSRLKRFPVYKEWLKWGFDYILTYYKLFQISGIDDAIKAEERKTNASRKIKWEINKISSNMYIIRKYYLLISTEYLYLRTAILADIRYFKGLYTEMLKLHDELEKLNDKTENLKKRILPETPYLKESTLNHLLNPKISVEMLKDLTVDDLKKGYKFFFLRKKPVYYYCDLKPEIGDYYYQVRSINDDRLFPVMKYEFRKELISITEEKQLLKYKLHNGEKKIEEFHERINLAYKYVRRILKSLMDLHGTCYNKLKLMKKVIEQQNMAICVPRNQLDLPLWKLVKPIMKKKDVRFVGMYCHKPHPLIAEMQHMQCFIEILIRDRIQEVFVIRKTLLAEIQIRNLYLSLVKLQMKRFLDGKNEDVIKHYKEHVQLNKHMGIPTKIKGYDKVFPKIHLKRLIFKYLNFISSKRRSGRSSKEKGVEKQERQSARQRALARSHGCVSKRKSSDQICNQFGVMVWLIKNLWEITDFEDVTKVEESSFYKVLDDNLITDDNGEVSCEQLENLCTPEVHENKVEDFVRSLVVPVAPPPSPADSESLPSQMELLLAKQDEVADIAFIQDELIYDYLKRQVHELASQLKEHNLSINSEIAVRFVKEKFRKWISKLFENWHFRIPRAVATNLARSYCTPFDDDDLGPEGENTDMVVHRLIDQHSSALENRNIERVKSDIAFTEHEDMLTKCIELMWALASPTAILQLYDKASGTEIQCPLTVYAKFDDNIYRSLTEEQNLLILNLIREHLKKYSKDILLLDTSCEHELFSTEELLKDWIAFAFEKIFLHPVQYVFLRKGDTLVKMYDAVEDQIKTTHIKTAKLQTRHAILSFLNDYKEYEKYYEETYEKHKKAEETRIKVREPLVKKWSRLKRELDKCRCDNARLERIFEKEKRRVFPMFGDHLIPTNMQLAKILD